MPSNQWVLAGVTVQDGRGTAYSQTYLYGDDDRSMGGGSDPTDREDGFYSRTEREPFGYGTVITVREDLSRVTARHHNQDYYRKRLLSESVEEDAAGNLFTRQAVAYRDPGTAALAPGESTTPFVGTFFPAEVSRETLIYEGVTTNPLDPGKRTAERRSYDLETGDLEGFTDDGDDGV
jgi:hypothetical protein